MTENKQSREEYSDYIRHEVKTDLEELTQNISLFIVSK